MKVYYSENDVYAAQWLRNLIAPGSCRRATSTTGPSRRWRRMTSRDTGSTTSSLALEGGLMHSPSPDGRGRSGPARARASRSASRERKPAQQTLAIFGPCGEGSSRSADLASSLASRLRTLIPGGTRSPAILRPMATPQGRVYWEHIASEHPIEGSGSGGAAWQTPRAQATAGKREPRTERGEGWSLALTEQVVPWPTPVGSDGTGRDPRTRSGRRRGGCATRCGRRRRPATTRTGATRRSTPRSGVRRLGGRLCSLALRGREAPPVPA